MSTNSIGRLWQSATRRRTERGVRVDRAVQELPQPPRHRAPARGAGPALREIIAQAPVERPPGYAALPLHADTARWLDNAIARLEDGAADDEAEAQHLLGRAAWAWGIVAELRGMKALAEAPAADGPQVPRDDRLAAAGRGPRCFGCGQPGDTRQCWNALEGRMVPLCPCCHPSADVVEERDGEEPELPEALASEPLGVPAQAAEVDEDMAAADAVWHRDHPGDLCPNWTVCTECRDAVPELAKLIDLPEPRYRHDAIPHQESPDYGGLCRKCGASAADSYCSVPDAPQPDPAEVASRPAAKAAFGPAAVPQLRQQRDTQTIPLAWGSPRVLDDTRTDLQRLDGAR